MNDEEFLLTTKDNPYNPFTHFDEWFAFDHLKGYCCNEYLARLCDYKAIEVSEDWEELERKRAINDILRIDPDKSYTRIYRDGHMDDSIDADLIPDFGALDDMD